MSAIEILNSSDSLLVHKNACDSSHARKLRSSLNKFEFQRWVKPASMMEFQPNLTGHFFQLGCDPKETCVCIASPVPSCLPIPEFTSDLRFDGFCLLGNEP